MLDNLQSSDFLPNLNTTFRIHLDGEADAVPLELTRVTGTGQSLGPEAREAFSLLFLGPVSPKYLAQHTYRLEHEQMGALDIFLVPLGPVEGRMQYEAIFT